MTVVHWNTMTPKVWGTLGYAVMWGGSGFRGFANSPWINLLGGPYVALTAPKGTHLGLIGNQLEPRHRIYSIPLSPKPQVVVSI